MADDPQTTIDAVRRLSVANSVRVLLREQGMPLPELEDLVAAVAEGERVWREEHLPTLHVPNATVNDNSALMPALKEAWGGGYQTAMDTLSELADEFGDEQMKQASVTLVGMLNEVKPDGKSDATVVKHELRNLMVAIDESPWHQHGATGEQVKRICLTETAIARIRAAI